MTGSSISGPQDLRPGSDALQGVAGAGTRTITPRINRRHHVRRLGVNARAHSAKVLRTSRRHGRYCRERPLECSSRIAPDPQAPCVEWRDRHRWTLLDRPGKHLTDFAITQEDSICIRPDAP
jgi:hypothetical protein